MRVNFEQRYKAGCSNCSWSTDMSNRQDIEDVVRSHIEFIDSKDDNPNMSHEVRIEEYTSAQYHPLQVKLK